MSLDLFDIIFAPVGAFVIELIEQTGLWGVFVLMAIESANIPVPSEIIMPFAGAVVALGELSFWKVVLAGALGNTSGSVISYYIGVWGGRPFVKKWGKYFFIHEHELEKGERWIKKYGIHVAFWSRLLPVVRTFISLPAGVVRAPIISFTTFTFIGSFIWSAFLVWLGYQLGESWHEIEPYFRQASIFIAISIVAIAGAYFWYHIKNKR